jgi:Asp-tRNA(Asn)/Glu-tRNA(Gln) amidotransferase A subunit family amidase
MINLDSPDNLAVMEIKMKNKYAFIPAWKLSELIRKKEVSPVEIIDEILERISVLNPRINAFLTVTADEAKRQAKQAEQDIIAGKDIPCFHGVPVSIKDLEATKGIRTTFGSLIYKDFVPTEDTIVVQRIRNSGAIIIGKTNTPEFGLSITTENLLGDHCRNPWNTERTTGGSSGGAAAAVAAGLGPIAQGSDGGGSIRIPSGWCGVFGIKPSYGRVPMSNAKFIIENAVIGPIARNVKDAVMLLDVMAGYDPRDAISLRQKPDFMQALDGNIKGLKVAFSLDMGYAKVEREVQEAVKSAALEFSNLGCDVEEATPPVGHPFDIFTPIDAIHAAFNYQSLLAGHKKQMRPGLADFIIAGKKVRAWEYLEYRTKLLQYRDKMRTFFMKYDLFILPTLATPAHKVGEKPTVIDGTPIDPASSWEPYWAACPFTPIFNLTQQPVANVPVGMSRDGLPICMMIAGRLNDEMTIIRAAAAFEKVRPWADRIPPLAL